MGKADRFSMTWDAWAGWREDAEAYPLSDDAEERELREGRNT